MTRTATIPALVAELRAERDRRDADFRAAHEAHVAARGVGLDRDHPINQAWRDALHAAQEAGRACALAEIEAGLRPRYPGRG